MNETRKLAAVMFTDIVGYTALMSHDEQKALSVLQKNRDIQKPLVKKFNGEFLKEMGDGTLLCFQSAFDAVQCAQEIQQSVRDNPDLNLRIGIHLGDIVFKEGDIYGDGVNVASRIEQLADTGGISISDQVYNAIRNKPGIKAIFAGEKILKNIDHPVKVYSVIGEGLSHETTKQYQKVTVSKDRIRRKIMLLLMLAILIILVALFFVFRNHLGSPKSPIADINNISWKNSIAVLPFVDMSPNKDQEYFCEGMAEEIINALSHITDLRVVARTSAFSFKGKNMDIREIGKKLNVGVILEGSVRKSGDNLRVTVQLINIEDGYHLWSEKYERKLANIFTVQEEIALAIVEKLEIKELGKEKIRMTKRHTDNIQAYNLYLKGRYFWNKRTKSDLEKAIEYFNKSLEKDPGYALAYSGLADCHTILAAYGFAPARPNFKKAKEMARKALEIDDMIAEVHASLGWVTLLADWAWENAEQEFIRAIELNPGYATAHHWYTYSFLFTARFDEALKRIYYAQELDPLSPIINRVVAEVLFYNQDYDKSIQAAQTSLEMVPDMPYAHLRIGANYMQKGLYQEALIEFTKEKAVWSNPDFIDTFIGITYAKMGKIKDAEQIKARLKEDENKCYSLAQLCFSLGENEEGFEWLGKAYDKKVWWLAYAKINVQFDNVRSDPRFQALLKKMGLEK